MQRRLQVENKWQQLLERAPSKEKKNRLIKLKEVFDKSELATKAY
jgi:hypothetical protein